MIEFLFLRGFIIAFISKKCQSLHNAYDGEDKVDLKKIFNLK